MGIERMIQLLEAEVKRHQMLAISAKEPLLKRGHEEVAEALLMAIGMARGWLK